MKENPVSRWLPLVLLVLFAAIYATVYPSLPGSIPVHFAGNGTPNGWASRTTFPLIMAGLGLLIYLLLTFQGHFDPKGENVESRRSVFLYVRNLILFIFFVLGLYSIRVAMSGKPEAGLLGFLMGILFIAIGNLLPRVPANWFVGIRSPWTLSSETIWKKTHRLGGVLFFLSGLILAATSVAGIKMNAVLIATLVPTVLVSGIIYPYALFAKEKKSTIKEKQ